MKKNEKGKWNRFIVLSDLNETIDQMKIESKEFINTLHTSINEIKNKTKSRSIQELKQIKNDVDTNVKEKINDMQKIKNDIKDN